MKIHFLINLDPNKPIKYKGTFNLFTKKQYPIPNLLKSITYIIYEVL